MSNTDTTTTADTTTTITAKPWHDGVEAETIGFWQNKGFKAEDPKALAAALTDSYRKLEAHMGVPPERLLKLPAADAKPEDIKAFQQRLGAPAEAKDYDFSAIKGADGNPMSEALAESLRASAHAQGLTKAAAAAIAAEVQKSLDSARSSETTINAGKLAEEKALLAKNWGTDFDYNKLKAAEGARRAGISPEAVAALENVAGYAAVMEHFRKIGANTSEDTFIERGATGGTVHTRDGAVARKSELMADKAWGDRYLKGGVAEKQEMDRLNAMIDGGAQ